MRFFNSYLPFYKRNLVLAGPVMVAQAGQMLVQFADNIMVGKLGTAQFAGVAFANSIFLIGMVFCTCFTQGLIAYAGQSYGKKEYRQVANYFFNSITLDFIMGLIVMFLLFTILPLMQFMGQDPDIIEYAKDYYIIMVISILPFVIFFGIRNFSESIGITKYAMYITIISNLINILLNWVLIYGKLGFPQLGVSGAALATLISRIIMFVSFLVIILSIRPYKHYIKFLNHQYLDKKKIKELLSTSIPVALQGLVEITAFSVSGIMLGWFGKTALAAHQIAITMASTSFMIAQGIGVASTIRVSHQFGEKDYRAAKKAGYASMHLSVALMSTAAILYIIFRHQIPYIFTSDPQVVSIAATLLIVSAGFQIFDAVQLSGIASLRALNDVKIPLLLSIVSYYFICLPLGYFCGKVLNFGPLGIWLGLMLGLFFAAIFFFYRFKKLISRYINNA